MSVSTDERLALSDLFTELGPDAPTLCAGWRTRDLAAHLVLRERRPDAAPGILLAPLAGHTKRVQDAFARRPWAELVDLVRGGPPAFSPTRIPLVDRIVNSVELFTHHEDVRRAQPGWEPRPADPARDAAAWNGVSRAGRMTLRRSPVGIVLRRPDGEEAVVRRGPNTVVVAGPPGELLLWAFGRDEVRVDFDGEPSAVDVVRGLRRSL
ncbi:TIGR03085 family metal-binding protein [Actinophytocola gossypii]|uniref:TIGR03085 family protein n=1 Tax=Actinophytocola gossypii TaxID=2812003 RepID=A0ABT2JC90_9PSEU|nr:TIGR03085 family metal-binding protein [Actinophytocola gossypii]MCT2585184.1 TIGR03085 family protein [Actinophytocola gossypii]